MSFNNNWRRKQELRLRPAADMIYKLPHIFNAQAIRRFDDDDPASVNRILDQHLGIDVQIRLANGQVLHGQEKFLSARYAKFQTLTVEYQQNAASGETGDWFKLAPQFYFCGYEHAQKEGTFSTFIIVDWCALVLASNRGHVHWSYSKNKAEGARASFRYIKFKDIPREAIIYRQSELVMRRVIPRSERRIF